jgi:thiol:disulfide interchange protein
MKNTYVLILLIITVSVGSLIVFNKQKKVQSVANEAAETMKQIEKANRIIRELSSNKETEAKAGETKPTQPKTYEELIKLLDNPKKPLAVLFFSAKWCGWCEKMKKETLKDDKVIKALDKYVFYIVDLDKEGKVAKKYEVGGIPAYCIIDKREKPFKKGAGYKSPSSFANWLK